MTNNKKIFKPKVTDKDKGVLIKIFIYLKTSLPQLGNIIHTPIIMCSSVSAGCAHTACSSRNEPH